MGPGKTMFDISCSIEAKNRVFEFGYQNINTVVFI